ncbi:unnamed protein product [Aureobasidium mustum]|uniref:Uncharacterized protein n=1 Tax=Aureobasidium mustum TaxID=2773714 RepID=A0A9N8JZ00_9PEZI|nr:unnamed protein product [Aureobasidium mustum]
MSTVSTDTASTTSNESQLTEKPSEDDMIVSITRQRRSAMDVSHTYQVPLSKIESRRSSHKSLIALFKSILRCRLQTGMDGRSIVWRMSETDQIAFVCSSNSFAAAVLDHKNANKKTIQLFVVENDGE